MPKNLKRKTASVVRDGLFLDLKDSSRLILQKEKVSAERKEHTHMETFAVRSHLKNNQGAEWKKHL